VYVSVCVTFRIYIFVSQKVHHLYFRENFGKSDESIFIFFTVKCRKDL